MIPAFVAVIESGLRFSIFSAYSHRSLWVVQAQRESVRAMMNLPSSPSPRGAS